MSYSNLTFYSRARVDLTRRLSLPMKPALKKIVPALVQTLRISEVLRYNKESDNMGNTVTKYDGKLFEKTPFHSKIDNVLTSAWMMDIAGTEYMLELAQPAHTGYAGKSNSEVFKLQTETWSVRFTLQAQDVFTATHTQQPLCKYMNGFFILGHFDPQGEMDDLENNATMFKLMSADLEPIPEAGV